MYNVKVDGSTYVFFPFSLHKTVRWVGLHYLNTKTSDDVPDVRLTVPVDASAAHWRWVLDLERADAAQFGM